MLHYKNKKQGNTQNIKDSSEIVKIPEDSVDLSGFNQELKILKDRYSVDFELSVTFPQYNILPEDVRLALIVLQNNKAKLAIGLKKGKDVNPKIRP